MGKIRIGGKEEMKLSDYFTVSEFEKSQIAIRRGIKNKMRPNHLRNAKTLCKCVLDSVSYNWGTTVINSGYRSPNLNIAIGSSLTSQHCFGEAADIEVPGVDNKEVAKWISAMLVFDQLILEYYKKRETNSGWIHVSYRKGRNRKQVLRAVKRGKKTVYLKGL